MNTTETRTVSAFNRARLCWLCAMGMATLMYLCLFVFKADIRFETNDDTGILRAFLGYETGEIPRFHIFIHGLLAYPLRWLSLAFPATPWFSILEIVLLWLACSVTVKSILQCFLKNGHPLWAGLLAGALFLAAFAMAYCCRVTFTVTAAMLGMAAVAQILSVDYPNASDGAILRSMALSLLLVALSYALRQISALPALAFCGLAFLYGYWQRREAGKPGLRPFLWSLALVAAVMGGLVAQREWDIDANQMREHLRWQQASENVLDYSGFTEVPKEVFEEIGWSDAEQQMVDLWYLLDQNINTAAFDRIHAAQLAHTDQSLGGRVSLAAATLGASVSREWLFMRTVWLLLLIAAFCLVGLIPRKGKRLWPALCVVATLLLSAAMLCYLASRGRLPVRAMLAPLLPTAAMLVCMLPGCLSPGAKGLPKALRIAGACVCAALTLWYAIPKALTLKPVLPNAEAGETDVYADLFEFALDNPDTLILFDMTLVGDTRMFPDLSGGVPHNLVFWGGWTAHSPAVNAQLAAYGIDGDRFSAADFLRENVRFATGVQDPPPNLLLRYLRAELGDGVDCDYDTSWGGVHIFAFYRTDE